MIKFQHFIRGEQTALLNGDFYRAAEIANREYGESIRPLETKVHWL